MYVMTEEDVRFCEEMAEWQKSHPGKFDVVFLAFRDKLWELAKNIILIQLMLLKYIVVTTKNM